MVLLFPADNYRVDPTPEACMPDDCDVDAFLTKPRIHFMTKTTEALISTLLELQTSPHGKILSLLCSLLV